MKIAIVGTGIAGTTIGWLLNRAGYEVTLIERHSSLGMDAHSFDFDEQRCRLRADLPPRMFNSTLWPKLSRLYERIGVETETVDLSQSFSVDGDPKPILFDRPVPSQLNLLLKSIVDSETRAILNDIRTMRQSATDEIDAAVYRESTFADYLAGKSYSESFVQRFLLPSLSSTVCTCSYDSLKKYPADTILRAMVSLIQPEGLLRAKYGAGDVVDRLTCHIEDIRLDTTVLAARRTSESVRLTFADQTQEEFDHLILATQANSASRIMLDLTSEESDTLNRFEYENIVVTLHRDPSFMPPPQEGLAAFQFHRRFGFQGGHVHGLDEPLPAGLGSGATAFPDHLSDRRACPGVDAVPQAASAAGH